jgi:predicted N-acetyltransferase YhbS
LPADGLSLVARDGGRLVGTVRLWNIDAGGAPALLLGPLGVDEEHRKLGVGAALMRLAVARAEAHGARAIVLVGDRA